MWGSVLGKPHSVLLGYRDITISYQWQGLDLTSTFWTFLESSVYGMYMYSLLYMSWGLLYMNPLFFSSSFLLSSTIHFASLPVESHSTFSKMIVPNLSNSYKQLTLTVLSYFFFYL